MEIFKDIEGYDGLYQVSNLGRVKSFNKNKKGKLLTPTFNRKGYTMVHLSGDVNKNITIHRLVAQAFLPNPENKPQVNHINGVKHDNRCENLEWNTPSENLLHAHRIGLAKGHSIKGEYHPLSKPVVQMTLDNIIVSNFAGASEAARQIGINQGGISQCCNGKCRTYYGFKWQYKI
jgi:hypothetical protein